MIAVDLDALPAVSPVLLGARFSNHYLSYVLLNGKAGIGFGISATGLCETSSPSRLHGLLQKSNHLLHHLVMLFVIRRAFLCKT